MIVVVVVVVVVVMVHLTYDVMRCPLLLGGVKSMLYDKASNSAYSPSSITQKINRTMEINLLIHPESIIQPKPISP